MPLDRENDLFGKFGGFTVQASGSVTRPADTTQYTAGDAIGTSSSSVITLGGCARQAGGSGLIVSAMVVDSAAQATLPDLELWLFQEEPAGEADNAAFTPTDAELLTLLGVIDFDTPFVGDATVGAGGNAVAQAQVQNIGFRCENGSRDLYGILVERGTYTPVSAEVFTVILGVLQD